MGIIDLGDTKERRESLFGLLGMKQI